MFLEFRDDLFCEQIHREQNFRLPGTPGQQEPNSRCGRQRQGKDLGVSLAAAILLDGWAEEKVVYDPCSQRDK